MPDINKTDKRIIRGVIIIVRACLKTKCCTKVKIVA